MYIYIHTYYIHVIYTFIYIQYIYIYNIYICILSYCSFPKAPPATARPLRRPGRCSARCSASSPHEARRCGAAPLPGALEAPAAVATMWGPQTIPLISTYYNPIYGMYNPL